MGIAAVFHPGELLSALPHGETSDVEEVRQNQSELKKAIRLGSSSNTTSLGAGDAGCPTGDGAVERPVVRRRGARIDHRAGGLVHVP